VREKVVGMQVASPPALAHTCVREVERM
jgi:hypothetical protein